MSTTGIETLEAKELNQRSHIITWISLAWICAVVENCCARGWATKKSKTRWVGLITARKRSCGKVMFHRCLSFSWGGGGGPHVTITHDVLGPTLLPSTPDTRYGTYPLPDIWWSFKLFHLRTYPPPLVLTCRSGHRKRAVRILLECCLVIACV